MGKLINWALVNPTTGQNLCVNCDADFWSRFCLCYAVWHVILHFVRSYHHHETGQYYFMHDDIMKWKPFPHNWPFVRGIHQSLVNFPHKGQWCGALMFPLICAWIKVWVNTGEAGNLRSHHTHYDIVVKERLYIMQYLILGWAHGGEADIHCRICCHFVISKPAPCWYLRLAACWTYCCHINWWMATYAIWYLMGDRVVSSGKADIGHQRFFCFAWM